MGEGRVHQWRGGGEEGSPVGAGGFIKGDEEGSPVGMNGSSVGGGVFISGGGEG